MRRLLRFSWWKLAVFLFVGLCIGLVVSWRQFHTQESFPMLRQMADVTQDELSLRPQFVGHLNLNLWREKTRQYASWGKKLLPALHQQVGLAIPYRPDCPVQTLATNSQSLVVLGFSGMSVLYVSLVGSFQARDYLRCAGKQMKQVIVGDHKMWLGDEVYWWEGEHGALVGMGMNPRPPLFSFGHQKKLKLPGKQGLLQRIVRQKGALVRGLRLEQSKHAGMFSLDGLEDMKLPQGITLQFHHMEGEILVQKQLQARIKISMRREKHAMRLMGIYYLASSLTPPHIRTMLKSWKAKRKENLVWLSYNQQLTTLFRQIRPLLWNNNASKVPDTRP